MPDQPSDRGEDRPDDGRPDGHEAAGGGPDDAPSHHEDTGDSARRRLADTGRAELERVTSLTHEQVTRRVEEWAPSGLLKRPSVTTFLGGTVLDLPEDRDEGLVNGMNEARETARRSPDEALAMTRQGPWWDVAARSCGAAVGFAEIGIDDERLEEVIDTFGDARSRSPQEMIPAVLERREVSETGTASISDVERLRLLRLVGDSEDSVAQMYLELNAFRTEHWDPELAQRAIGGLQRSLDESRQHSDEPRHWYLAENTPATALGMAAGCAELGYGQQAAAAVAVFRETQKDKLRVLTDDILAARRAM